MIIFHNYSRMVKNLSDSKIMNVRKNGMKYAISPGQIASAVSLITNHFII